MRPSSGMPTEMRVPVRRTSRASLGASTRSLSNTTKKTRNKGQGIAPELLLVEEPNELLALGFTGRQSRFMPELVKSSFSGTEYRQEFTYKYTVPADWKIGEQIDGMTITINNQEGGFSKTWQAVLTFDGI